MGVNAIKLRKGDELTGMDIITPDNKEDLLVVTAKGLGKRTALSEYATRTRYGMGISTLANALDVTGPIVAIRTVTGDEDITLISSDGKMIRTEVKHIPRLSRVTRGARIMNLRDGDTVASIALIDSEAEIEIEAEAETDVEAVETTPAE
jgi:DNA gyrase subunit A